MNALVAHNPKFASKFVTFADLQALPAPAPRSARHQPIHHADLIAGIRAEAGRRGLDVKREQFALGAKGAALFGIMDLAPNAVGVWEVGEGRGLSFGFRASNDGQLALKGVAGQRVFVCDNLALSGDIFVMRMLHLTGVDLASSLVKGFDRFALQAAALDSQIATLQGVFLTDRRAKEVIYNVFADGVLPSRLFDDVHQFYFAPGDDMTDCQPRSAWGVHNAMTRAVKALKPVPAFQATVKLGRHMGLTTPHSGRPDEPGDIPAGAIA